MNHDLEDELRALRPAGLDAERRRRLESAVRAARPRARLRLPFWRLAAAALVTVAISLAVLPAVPAPAVVAIVSLPPGDDGLAYELGRLQTLAHDPERLMSYLDHLPRHPAPERPVPTLADLIAEHP